ncbi:hypothetical protein K443DRAFT_685960 [Laccaria amethystina LaAM-08-1]|uniref:Uncharacterized protein n=1 Tax=Laccaria amethystina LaAM-08-1 TaxID=1095629 RepID=A0A0C9X1N8_9AGAR|nr:hypothetical protein K443DRAFT_685960 [Laccaria amethystina LaAM-08-1]
MASVTYGIQAVRVPSGSFNFVLLITFHRPVSQTMSLLIMHPTVHLACHTPTRLSTTNDIDNVFTVRRRG